MKRRVIRRFSPTEIALGSQMTPPLAPPNGTSITAHFQVIQVASAFTSDADTEGWNRIPPLPGPRTVLCSTR